MLASFSVEESKEYEAAVQEKELYVCNETEDKDKKKMVIFQGRNFVISGLTRRSLMNEILTEMKKERGDKEMTQKERDLWENIPTYLVKQGTSKQVRFFII
jgi:hypothetical protein